MGVGLLPEGAVGRMRAAPAAVAALGRAVVAGVGGHGGGGSGGGRAIAGGDGCGGTGVGRAHVVGCGRLGVVGLDWSWMAWTGAGVVGLGLDRKGLGYL